MNDKKRSGPFDSIREATGSWVDIPLSFVDRLTTPEVVVIAGFLALVAIAGLILRAGSDLTAIGLTGALAVAALVAGLTGSALYVGVRRHAKNREGRADDPLEPGDGQVGA